MMESIALKALGENSDGAVKNALNMLGQFLQQLKDKNAKFISHSITLWPEIVPIEGKEPVQAVAAYLVIMYEPSLIVAATTNTSLPIMDNIRKR